MPTEISGSTGVNKIQDGTVVNADINSSAAIAGTKLVMPAGGIIQVVQDQVLSSTTISNSNTWTGIGLSVDITPRATSSKMLILVSCSSYCDTTDQTSGLTVFRDTTNLGYSDTGLSPFYMNFGGGAEDLQVTTPIVYYDAVSTTSELTYEVKGKADKSNYRINGLREGIAQLIVMEIAG
jgi:hypothetical protein